MSASLPIPSYSCWSSAFSLVFLLQIQHLWLIQELTCYSLANRNIHLLLAGCCLDREHQGGDKCIAHPTRTMSYHVVPWLAVQNDHPTYAHLSLSQVVVLQQIYVSGPTRSRSLVVTHIRIVPGNLLVYCQLHFYRLTFKLKLDQMNCWTTSCLLFSFIFLRAFPMKSHTDAVKLYCRQSSYSVAVTSWVLDWILQQ